MKASKLFNFRSSLIVVATSVLSLTSPLASADTATFNTVGTFNWVCPAGVTSVQVECWGGGGAGGPGAKQTAGNNTSQNGGGGGGGAYARNASVPVTPGLSYTITIPAAAVSGANGIANGGGIVSGGNVTFVGDSGATVTAAGGTGGKCANSGTSNATNGQGGGAGGTTAASVGDAGGTFAGGTGSGGNTGTTSVSGSGGGGAGDANAGGAAVTFTTPSNPPPSTTTPGSGGSAGGGAGGTGRGTGNTTSQIGGPGATPGGGGGGAKNVGNSTTLGGLGGLGQIILTYTVAGPSLTKDNNSDNLNLTTSWVGGVVPGFANKAIWDSTVTGANTTVLGANATWAGIQIVNPGGLVTINPGNTLTLGVAPVDIDLSAATQDLTLNCDLALGAPNVWDVASGRTLTLGGVVSGSAAVTKQGLGTAILSGTNTYTGTTIVNAGKLTVTGSTAQGASTDVLVANAATGNAVLNIQGPMAARYLSVGGVTGASGAVNIATGGSFTGSTTDTELGFTFGAGTATGGYGYLGMSGGTVNTKRFQFGGQNVAAQNGVGVGVISGGIVNADSYIILSRYGTSPGTIGSLTVATGGTLNHTSATAGQNLALGWQGAGRAELNLTGGAITSATGRSVAYGGGGATWTGTGIVNLDAGTLTTTSITTQGSGSTSYLNFNGGTLKAVSTQAAFLPALTGVYVNGAFGSFNGGAVIDSNLATITIGGALITPTGNGVATIPITTGGSGYIGAPAVSITDGGSGFGATAIANMVDDGTGNGTLMIASITLTNPGNDYTAPAASLVGGGNGVTAATLGTLTSAANTSGGLTTIGLGTLTLSGANTYTGATLVSTGTLKSSTAGSATTHITVAAGAAGGVVVAATDGQWLNTGDLTLNNNSAVVIDYGSTTPSATVAPIAVGNLALGTNLGLKLEAATYSGLAVSQPYPLITWTTSGPADGSAFTTILTSRLGGTFSVAGKTLFLTVTANAAGLPISWNAGDGTWNTVATNWVDASLATTAYIDSNDGVIFGDAAGATGNPTITLDSVVSPTGVTMNSTSHDYTISGSGGIAGTGRLTLDAANTKTLTLTTANTYTGGTVINAGTLKLSGVGTPGAVGSAVAVSSGALLDLNGTNQTIAFTAGTGVGTAANNSGSGTSTLTFAGTPTINGSLVTIHDNTATPGGKVAVNIIGNTQPMSNANTYSGGTTVNAAAFLYLNSGSPLGAGTGPIILTTAGTTVGTGSGLVVDGVTYANDITGAGYVHNNASAASTTVFTGNINISGPFIFRAGTGIVYNFAGDGTTSSLSGVIGSTTSMVNGAVATGSIIKSGTGTLTLSGANLYSGTTTVSTGTLNLTGNRTATAGAFTVGNLNGTTGILNVSNGTFQTGNVFVGVGNGTAVGVINQSGGTLTMAGDQLLLGNGGVAGTLTGNGGNGTYNLSGGTLTATAVANRGVMLGTNDGGTSTFNLSGTGNLTLTGVSQLMVGRSDSPVTNTTNLFNQTGGTASVTILTIGGAAAAATGLNSTFTVTGGTFGATSFTALGVGNSGIATLNIGGTANVTLPAFPVVRGSGTTATINFDGGTLRPLAASATYMGGLTNAFIKAGGARIDTTNGSITIAQSLLADSTGGGLTKIGSNTLTLSGINTYTGNTTVNAGTLVLADNAQLKFVIGATSGTNNIVTGVGTIMIDGDFNIDTTLTDASALTAGSWTLVDAATLTETFSASFTILGAGWSETANVWTKTVGSKKYTFTEATGILALSPAASYASWIDGFFPGETNPLIIGAGADPDHDGIANGMEMVIGGNPATGMDTALLPTLELVTDPVGIPVIPAGKYLLFTYRRSDLSVAAGVTAGCETDTDLVGPWTAATGAPGVVIQVDDNFTFTPPAAANTDRVRVYVPRGANTVQFGRLNVLVP